VLQTGASAVVPAPPADVLKLRWATARYSERVTSTEALTRTGGPGVLDLGLMRGHVDRDNRCTVETFAQLATRELGEQARV
jgi:hypothetical protein